jgi:ComF family protein
MLARLLSLVAPALCTACRSHAGRSMPLCRACRAELARSALAAWTAAGAGPPVWSAFGYEGPAGALVRALKFRGRVALADAMAAQVVASAPPVVWDGALVPVPLHPARLRRRGFNQADLLARALARRTGLGVACCLARQGPSAQQMGRGRAARLRAAAGRFQVSGQMPPRAVLVDDVVTTGATLTACRDALRDAGCREIVGITYARTLGR